MGEPDRARCFVIAELANTHSGSFDIAETLTIAAAGAGADAIKYQYFLAEEIVSSDHPEYGLFKSFEMEPDEWRRLVETAHAEGLAVYSDIFSEVGARFMDAIACDGFKVHSSDTGNFSLLKALGAIGKPVLLSAGASSPRDVAIAVETLRDSGAKDITLMLGFQGFPTELSDSKLEMLPWYRREFGLPVGYADHVAGDSPMAVHLALLPVAMGASVIEKHITYDRSVKPEDYEAAIEPEVLAELVQRIRDTETAVGNFTLELSDAEVAYNHRMKKYPMVKCDLPAGEVIDEETIILRRVSGGDEAYPADTRDIVGHRTRRPVTSGLPIRYSWLDFKVAVLVAVRLQSTRLPGKALIDIEGRPSLVHLIERLKGVELAHELVVCTTPDRENDPIAAIAGDLGVRVFRGADEDVMARFIGGADLVGADIVVRVTGDDILSDPAYIDQAIRHHLDQNAEYTNVVGLPHGVDREVISIRALKWAHEHAEDTSTTEYMTWYLDDGVFFRRATVKAAPEHYRPQYRLTLDTSEDLGVIREIFRRLYRPERMFTLSDVVKLLDSVPELSRANSGVEAKLSRHHVNTRIKLSERPYAVSRRI